MQAIGWRRLLTVRAKILILAAVAMCGSPVHSTLADDDPFSQFVRTTEPLAPQEQRKTFHLPPGFEIQLVAADPDIRKPMNLAFDARGRLWVSETGLYPFPAKDEASKKDTIRVLEDLDGDGSADKITTFADKLDIPVGLLPLGDGSRCIAYDINNTTLYTDTDGDGKADQREVLYSGWGFKDDTHGMSSNYRRGFDGWVYGCHGFNNTSNVQAERKRDGSPSASTAAGTVHMRSGNTYRFKLDGSKIEMWTIGQINPFGFCFDALGNQFTSDSHSKPNYQLLRGGHYEAFDRNTDDGLGLAPAMMAHLHGSTAIAGIVHYAADHFPEAYRGDNFVGNVMTGRLNRDKLEYHGSSPRAVEQPDFLTTDDPWFRPVNTILGPDGALYVADFYNRIIGHYEVKLDDPRRDHERGRIWRIVYDGDKPHAPAQMPQPPLAEQDVAQLIQSLCSPNLTVRMMATDQLTDRIGADAVDLLQRAVGNPAASPTLRAHALWALHRLGGLTDALLVMGARDDDRVVRIHAMRIIAETRSWSDLHQNLAFDGLDDPDALVQRCATDALGRHPSIGHVLPLIRAQSGIDAQDTHLMHTNRMALRDQLRDDRTFAQVSAMKLSAEECVAIADVALGLPTAPSGAFIARHLEELATDPRAATFLRHAVRYVPESEAESLVRYVQQDGGNDMDFEIELMSSLLTGIEQRGSTPAPALIAWGEDLTNRVLEGELSPSQWTALPLGENPAEQTPSPWMIQERAASDGQSAAFLSSLPRGETLTGVLRSKVFSIPPALDFFMAGHNGFPGTNEPPKNIVRLRDAETQDVLMQANPPRHDLASGIHWELSQFQGRRGFIEITDGDTGTGYAWIAVGRFDPPVVQLPTVAPNDINARLVAASRFAVQLKLTEAAPRLEKLIADGNYSVQARAAALLALASLDANRTVSACSALLREPDQPMALREAAVESLAKVQTPEARSKLLEAIPAAPARLQTKLGVALASSHEGANALIDAVTAGTAPARLLQDQGIADRIAALKLPGAAERIKRLTQGLPTVTAERQALIEKRRDGYLASLDRISIERGQQMFTNHCVACHQIDNNGGEVGPNLDGVALRGVERLIEDLLDPSRNVDPAFRYSNIILRSSQLITGLEKRQEGATIIFIDTTGKEQIVKKSDIKQRIESKLSAMPDNFHELMTADEFNDLIGFLLSTQAR